MNKKPLPDVDTLHKLLILDADAGLLYWRERDRVFFKTAWRWKSWNDMWAGQPAFETVAHGYKTGGIFNVKYFAHRIIWLMHHGSMNDDDIDHINHDRIDNRISNLRLVSRQGNMRNLSLRADNKSGYVGVSYHSGNKRWHARIKINDKYKHLGYFKEKQSAVDARKSAEKKYGFHVNHGLATPEPQEGE